MNLIKIAICFLIVSLQCSAQTWSAVGNGVYGGYVNAMYANDSILYAGGTFIGPGSHIAQWDGVSWSSLSSGINGDVYSLCIYKNNLYAGGYFSKVGGISAAGFVEWNGSNWIPWGAFNTVTALDTANNFLYSSSYYSAITRFNGSIGWFMSGNINIQINKFILYKNNLYVAGYGYKIGGGGLSYEGFLYQLKLSGTSFTSILVGAFYSSSNMPDLYTMAIHDSNLYIGGTFDTVNGQVIHNIAVYNGNNFLPVGGSINGTVNALTQYNGKLYAGGYFDSAGTTRVNNVACWNDTLWTSLGNGVNNEVFSMTTFKGDLYVGGGFTSPGNYIAKFNPAKIPDTIPIFNSVTLYPNPNNGFFYNWNTNKYNQFNSDYL
jgi:trimeric autotransporter adhesin